jgi:signal transduction histidine kinase
MLELISLCFFVIVNVFMGFSVVARNYKDRSNLIFGGFITTGMGWAVLNYMSNHGSHLSKLIGNRGAFTAGLAAMIFLWFFSQFFPRRKKASSWQVRALWFSPVALFISVTPLLVQNFKDQPGKGVTSIEPGIAYVPFVLYLAFVFVLAALNFKSASKHSKGTVKQRVDLIYFGIGASFVWGLVLSAAVPFFAPSSSASKYGPFGLLFLTGAIFYSVTRHKLFDIRRVVLRSMVFFVTQVLLMALYIALIILVASLLFRSSLGTGNAIFVGLIAAFISVTLPFLVRYFRKITKQLFFTDIYETQTVINMLTRELVGTINLEELSTRSIKILNDAIRARYAVLVVKRGDDGDFSQIGTMGKQHVGPDLIHAFGQANKEVFMADNESESEAISNLMMENGVSLAVQLHSHDKLIGYLCFSEKLSGRLFSDQDIKLVLIASNEVALALQNAQRYEEIEQFNLTLKDKVDQATNELRHTNQKLKALDEAKDEFISMASHQLRTPLTSVKGYVSMVLEGDVGKVSSQQREMLEQAFASSQRMVYLIADLLNVSRLKTGKFVIETAPTYLPDVIETEMKQLVESAKARNLELTFNKPKEFPTLNLDETKTRQVIMNFMDNAIYYTPAGGHIRIELSANDKSVEYKVVDDGLGVPKAEMPHLFTKFYRAGNAKKARPDGTGLGLFMAKKVIIAQGGSIIFESEENKGSTFGFSFPLNALQSAPKASSESTDNK